MENPTKLAYTELQNAFDHYNQALFNGQLPPCLITMQREKRSYGYFSSKRFVHRNEKITTDEIAINPAYFAVIPLLEILQTIVHEMVHAWQFHFGKPGRRGYHNKEWANKMEAIGLMPSHTGEPGGARTGEKMMDYPVPNGLFMQATHDLLATGFGISWLDRFPAKKPQPINLINHSEEEGFELTQDFNNPLLDEELTALLESTENRSNRTKYRCPNCFIQVWGKPGLSVLCGAKTCKKSIMMPCL